MERPTYNPFQGGIAKKGAKILCLIGFSYAAIEVFALGRKNLITAVIGLASLVVLYAITWMERNKYWEDLKEWSAVKNGDPDIQKKGDIG